MFTEQLTTTSGRKLTVRYTPVKPGVGSLVIEDKKESTEYRVSEIPTQWNGRAAHFVKPNWRAHEGGCDYYSVYVGRDGETQCDCKGHARFGTCKHTQAMDAIVGNGWINQPLPQAAAPVAPEPVEESEAVTVEMPIPKRRPKGWCANYRSCGGVNVPCVEVPGTSDELCEACEQAALLAARDQELPGYSEHLDAETAKLDAEPGEPERRRAYDDEREAEFLRRKQEIDVLEKELVQLQTDNFRLPEPDEAKLDRLMVKLRELKAELVPVA